MRMLPVDPAILRDDDPLLRTVSEEVPPSDFGDRIANFVSILESIARRNLARGLSAVQVGMPVRALVVLSSADRRQELQYRAFINPVVTRTLNRFTTEREGCLSIPPRKWGDVSRPAKCDVTWLDVDGGEHSETLSGDTARIFQHEFDHLNGVLMTDLMVAA
jgi:peptide deformylase